ncbi:Cyclic GMP-AMP synthase [Vibrio chagasii]|nr:Cyclic GMP-AMP synthase [Vibrio chagasii]
MNWNLHHYYTNRKDGLIGKLLLSNEEEERLVGLRNDIRKRITKVFEEIASIAREQAIVRQNKDFILSRLHNTRLRYLNHTETSEVSWLLSQMDKETLKELSSLKPRFWTQGSFKYKTLNRPFQAGQEMDIDDGTYLPMTFFESEPKIGHQLLTLLVDASLKSLVAENYGWEFDSKRTCARVKIAREKTHIDVPMYAIPKDQFIQKEEALLKAARNRLMNESFGHVLDSAEDREYEKLDSENVNLALRDGTPGSPKWMNSDPKVVEDWFENECSRIGRHLRKVCRYMKAWRDAQWEVGGPSSISLMAAIVEVLQQHSVDPEDMGTTMKIVADNLYYEFLKGVESPDDTDERPLFPPESLHTSRELDITSKLRLLPEQLRKAENAETKAEALSQLSLIFGERVFDKELIKRKAAAPAYLDEPTRMGSSTKISSSMVSG